MAAAIGTHRKWLRSVGEGFTGADTSLAVERTERSGDVVTVDAIETTMLAYEKIRGDEPPATGYTARWQRLVYGARRRAPGRRHQKRQQGSHDDGVLR